jgi:hypothetical protein
MRAAAEFPTPARKLVRNRGRCVGWGRGWCSRSFPAGAVRVHCSARWDTTRSSIGTRGGCGGGGGGGSGGAATFEKPRPHSPSPRRSTAPAVAAQQRQSGRRGVVWLEGGGVSPGPPRKVSPPARLHPGGHETRGSRPCGSWRRARQLPAAVHAGMHREFGGSSETACGGDVRRYRASARGASAQTSSVKPKRADPPLQAPAWPPSRMSGTVLSPPRRGPPLAAVLGHIPALLQ